MFWNTNMIRRRIEPNFEETKMRPPRDLQQSKYAVLGPKVLGSAQGDMHFPNQVVSDLEQVFGMMGITSSTFWNETYRTMGTE
jgi:hypothetical protein